jgi:hypothetical protein
MTPLAQTTADRLSRAIATAPGAMSELLQRYGCEVPASPESLALMSSVAGERFTDDLFILLNQAERAGGSRYAAATGDPITTTTTSKQRTGLGAGLASIVDFLKRSLTVNTSGSAGGVDYNATNDPSEVPAEAPRILGLSQGVFVAGVLVLLLAAVVLLVNHRAKK